MLRTVVAVALSALTLAAQGWVDRTPLSPTGSPSPRQGQVMCWDAARNQVLMYGGFSPLSGLLTETWSWNGSAWTQRTPATLPAPDYSTPGLQGIAMTFHPPTNEVVLVAQGFTYTWNGSNWSPRAGANVPNDPSGPPCWMAMARDTARGETVLFVGGGLQNTSPPSGLGTAKTYVWDGFAWSPRPTATRPAPSGNVSMAFDPVAARLVLQVTSSAGLSTYWEWTGSNWLQRFYSNAPARGGAMVCDTATNQMVMLDGVLDNQPNHTWTIAGTSMQRRATPIEPARRTNAAMVFDPVRGKTLLFGGSNGFELGDTWEFTPGADASYSTFGAGCAGSRGIPSLAAQSGSVPRVGQTFSLQIGNLPFNGLPFLFLGFSNTDFGGTPLPFSLGGLGAPGCNVLMSGDQSYLLPNLLGTSVWSITVPNLPGVQFYNQVFVFDPPANAFGVSASNAGQGVVGV